MPQPSRLGNRKRKPVVPPSVEVEYLDFEILFSMEDGTMLADLGLLLLRLTLGAVFLAHGAQKAFGAFGGPGFEGAAGFIGSMGCRPARVWAAVAVGARPAGRLSSV